MPQTINSYIKNEYGSKTGFMHLSVSRTKELFGLWNQYKSINWNKVNTLVFICMGNICRSPLGEGIAKFHGIKTRSYGLTAPNGDPADPRAIEIAKNFDVDLTTHQTTSIKDAYFEETDLIIAMEPQHFSTSLFPKNVTAQKTLIGLWHEDYRPYLHDPYNTNEYYFNKCEMIVIEATKNIISKLN